MTTLLILGMVLGQVPLPGPLGPPCQTEPTVLGTLWPKGATHGQLYFPAEGDIVLLSSVYVRFAPMYIFAHTWHPYHSGIVVRAPSGALAFLESGGYSPRRVTVNPLEERLKQYLSENRRGHIWIRKPWRPFTAEQSARLTEFAGSQLGKPFTSWGKLAALAIPGRPRQPTHSGQQDWFCSEIVAHAVVVAGLLAPQNQRPAALTPRDLFLDKRIDLSGRYAPPASWSPTRQPPPPAPCWFPN